MLVAFSIRVEGSSYFSGNKMFVKGLKFISCTYYANFDKIFVNCDVSSFILTRVDEHLFIVTRIVHNSF